MVQGVLTLNKRINNKINMVVSPKGKEGKSTIASFLATKAAKAGHMTALIELDRYLSGTPFITGIKDMGGRSLSKAIQTECEKDIKTNFQPHPTINDLYVMALDNLVTDTKINVLRKFPIEKIQDIIKLARQDFEIVFLDCPSSYDDNGFLAAVDMGIDRLIYVLDNDINSLTGLKLYDTELDEMDLRPLDTMLVINKDIGLIDESHIRPLKEKLRVIGTKKIYKIPFCQGIIQAKNGCLNFFDAPSLNFKERKIKKVIEAMYRQIIDFEGDTSA